jgi:ParB-like chromosome segregation protein Spo0J
MLTDRGFTWEFRTGIPLEEFDEERSLHNQARVGKPLDRGTVDRYVAALGNGDVFPAILTAETSQTAPLLIADGNHRFQAHKTAGAKELDAYVILGAQPSAITMLTFEANTRHGLPTNETDRLHQALYLLDNNVSAEEAARRLGLKVHTLRAAANLANVDRRADEAGLLRTRWDKLPAAVKNRLGQISTDEGFAAMAKLTLDAGLRTEDVSAAVGQLNALRSSAKQVQYVTALRNTYAEDLQTGGVKQDTKTIGRQTRSPKTAYGMTLGQLAVLPAPSSITQFMTDADRPEWLRRTEEAIARLTEIRDALKQ